MRRRSPFDSNVIGLDVSGSPLFQHIAAAEYGAFFDRWSKGLFMSRLLSGHRNQHQREDLQGTENAGVTAKTSHYFSRSRFLLRPTLAIPQCARGCLSEKPHRSSKAVVGPAQRVGLQPVSTFLRQAASSA
jgi:hypothetical protein